MHLRRAEPCKWVSPLTDSNRRPPPYHGGLGAVLAYTAGHSRSRFPCKSAHHDVSAVPARARACSSWCTRLVPAECCLFSKHTTEPDPPDHLGRIEGGHSTGREPATSASASSQWRPFRQRPRDKQAAANGQSSRAGGGGVSRCAISAASSRLATSSFRRMCETWTLAVLTLMTSSAASSRFV